jgi:hypothetical protein
LQRPPPYLRNPCRKATSVYLRRFVGLSTAGRILMHMNKNLLAGLVLAAVVGAGVYWSLGRDSEQKPVEENSRVQANAFDGRNSTFTIGGKSVTLVEGVSETPIANSSAKVTTTYFGNEAEGDLNGDGMADRAFLVTQNTGGSGTFYYAVVALKTSDGYKTTNAFLVGDRIAPQTTEINPVGELYVNYADRKPGEPMTAKPSAGKTLFLKVTPAGVLEGLMK